MSEIDDLDDGLWDDISRAQYVKDQVNTNATSHREYYRRRTNTKWDVSQLSARSNSPCSPLSKWRRYTYIKQDRHHTVTEAYVDTTFEIVPSEANFSTTVYEAESLTDVACGECDYRNSSTTSTTGFSGTGYLDLGGYDDFITWTINVEKEGIHPISFRFANGGSSYNGNR